MIAWLIEDMTTSIPMYLAKSNSCWKFTASPYMAIKFSDQESANSVKVLFLDADVGKKCLAMEHMFVEENND